MLTLLTQMYSPGGAINGYSVTHPKEASN